MLNLILLFVQIVTTLVRLARPGGLRSVVAESVLLRHQLLVLNRSRRRAPNLGALDRLITGWCALLVSPRRLIRCAIVVKPSTVLLWEIETVPSTSHANDLFDPFQPHAKDRNREFAFSIAANRLD